MRFLAPWQRRSRRLALTAEWNHLPGRPQDLVSAHRQRRIETSRTAEAVLILSTGRLLRRTGVTVGVGSAAPVVLIEVQTYGPRPVSTSAAGP